MQNPQDGGVELERGGRADEEGGKSEEGASTAKGGGDREASWEGKGRKL